ncbi:MAG: DMT family transporter [Anaerolineae bacterium]|jgi:drug/metabolite transporter (DMT)-like permease|nr:DMT family transporter [Anaerolineae bacterium]
MAQDMKRHRRADGAMAVNRPRVAPWVLLAIGVLAVSTASTFIRLAQLEVTSLAVAAWRLTFASAMLVPFVTRSVRDSWRKLTRSDWGLLFVSGAVLAVHFHTWITSLGMTSVAASVVLVSTNPLFVVLLSRFLLKEPLHSGTITGILVAVAGSAIIGLEDFGAGTHQILGDVLAVSGALAVAIYLLIGRRLRPRLPLVAYILPVYGCAAIILMALALATRTPLVGYAPRNWLLLLLVALIPQGIGHSSFNWALRHVSPTIVSLAALAEPIGSTLLAWLVLGEAATLITLAGGVLILAGIALAVHRP